MVIGCVALHVTIAFREALWPGVKPLTSVPVLAVFTLGAGLVAGLAAAAIQLARTRPGDELLSQ